NKLGSAGRPDRNSPFGIRNIPPWGWLLRPVWSSHSLALVRLAAVSVECFWGLRASPCFSPQGWWLAVKTPSFFCERRPFGNVVPDLFPSHNAIDSAANKNIGNNCQYSRGEEQFQHVNTTMNDELVD